MTERARAAVYMGTKAPFDLREYPVPEPLADDMVIRVRHANICGTDLHVWRGDTDLKAMGLTYGLILGHEMTGHVARLGRNVSTDSLGQSLSEGDRVVYTYTLACGRCRPCARGMPHACLMAIASPLRSCDEAPHFYGGFADYYYLKAGQSVFKLDSTVPDAEAAGANCALSQVVHGLLDANLTFGESVVVQGAGGLGLYACAVARDMGAHKVIAIDSVPARLELAKKFGADDVIDLKALPEARDRVSKVMDLTGGWGADVVVEVVGFPEVIPEGIKMLSRGGRYVEMGCVNPRHTYKADPSLLVTSNRSLRGVSLYPPFTLKRSIDFLARARGRYPFGQLSSHHYPLEHINQAFQEADMFGADQRPVTRASLVMA